MSSFSKNRLFLEDRENMVQTIELIL